MSYRKSFLVSLPWIAAVVAGCTGNPLGGGDRIAPPKRQIRGQVQLLGDAAVRPNDVYVWLEGFNLGTRTDETGRFQVTLPPPATQNVAGGVSGFFRLYYYVANYDLEVTDLALENGELLLPKGELNESGELRQPKKLVPFLRIETSVTPSSLTYAEFDSSQAVLTVRFTLEALDDTVSVFFPTQAEAVNLPVLFREVNTGRMFILEGVPSVNEIQPRQVLSRAVPRKREVFVVLSPGVLSPGDYEVLPYLLPNHEPVPADLLRSLGEDVTALGPRYLELPMKRLGGAFRLR